MQFTSHLANNDEPFLWPSIRHPSRQIHIASFKDICSHSPINACWRSVGDRTMLGSASHFLFNNSHIWQVNPVKSLPRTGSRSTKQTSHFQDCINLHGLSAIAVKMACQVGLSPMGNISYVPYCWPQAPCGPSHITLVTQYQPCLAPECIACKDLWCFCIGCHWLVVFLKEQVRCKHVVGQGCIQAVLLFTIVCSCEILCYMS